MKRYFAYIRVSTTKQGEHGSSLQEQRGAIDAYAKKHEIEIVRWYEEIETAAKLGRRVFSGMIADRRREGIAGIVFHKIDRSARHLKDWAILGDLIDENVDVRFAHESFDMRSRGGRLAADIQAVVAADYIRNLREETRKGFYGRLKQGLYPMRAPLGYLDTGKGKPKTIDPVRGSLIRQTFELYAAGEFGLIRLCEEMFRRGLANRGGKKLTRSTIALILHNPFYCGIIRLPSTGEQFDGIHEPLISKALFDRVQDRFAGKASKRWRKHDFVFRRILGCATCNATLVGELQKSHVYYRCHSPSCKGVCVREERVDRAVRQTLLSIQFNNKDFGDIRDIAEELMPAEQSSLDDALKSLNLQISACDDRLNRLTDAYLEGAVDREAYELRKAALIGEKRSLKDKLEVVALGDSSRERALEKLELAKSALLSYETANPSEKRDLLLSVSSNFSVSRKSLAIALQNPFLKIAKTVESMKCGPSRAANRTLLRELWLILMDKTLDKPPLIQPQAQSGKQATNPSIAQNVPEVP